MTTNTAAVGVAFTDEQIDRLGHWLSECLDDAAPLNERTWRRRAAWMVAGPTFQSVMLEVTADTGSRDALARCESLADWHETKAEKARAYPGGEVAVMEKAAQVHDDAARRLRAAIEEPA